MTELSSLTLSYFRSHRLTKIEPEGACVALFGPNGAGKTNVLEAVSMLSPGRGMRRATAADMVRRPDGIGWKVTGAVANHKLETWVEGTGSRQVKIDDKSASQIALGKHLSVVWLTPQMDRLWTEGADGRRRFLDRVTMSYFPKHSENSLTYEKAMRERNRLLKDQINDPHWYHALEVQMGEAGSEIIKARRDCVARLVQAQDGAKTEFPRAGLSLVGSDDIDAQDATELTAAMAESRSNDLRAGRALVGPHRADLAATYVDKGVDARDASTGEQKALLISIVLANARSLKAEGAAPIVLLDEVAAHLDENRRNALFSEIAALDIQAWMTGTGPELFEGVAAGTMKVAVSEGAEGSQAEVR